MGPSDRGEAHRAEEEDAERPPQPAERAPPLDDDEQRIRHVQRGHRAVEIAGALVDALEVVDAETSLTEAETSKQEEIASSRDYVEGMDVNNFISKVTVPTIIPYFADKAKANGTAVVICPGGGYGGVVDQPEGHGIAKWLNEHGVDVRRR